MVQLVHAIMNRMNLKKLWKFATDNYFISIFFAAILFVGFVSVFRLFFTKPTYMYAKVKMGQGLWWTSTAKPSIWFVKSLKKGESEKSLTGQSIAEILSVRFYPWYNSGQFDIFLTLKLNVSSNKRTGKYNFKRSTIAVGSPIDLEFPSTQVSGTIITLSEKPFKEQYEEKNITLVKRGGYNKDFTNMYDQIRTGDYFFDGQDRMFTVLDKSLEKNIWSVTNNFTGQVFERDIESTQNIIVSAKIKVKKEDGNYIYAEDQPLLVGRTISLATQNYVFSDFQLVEIK